MPQSQTLHLSPPQSRPSLLQRTDAELVEVIADIRTPFRVQRVASAILARRLESCPLVRLGAGCWRMN